mgnify:CR=1 FL=1
MIENMDNKYIQTFEYETSINSDGNILGVCELGTATIQMINDSNTYSSLKGKWLKTIHGSFYVYNVEPVQEKVNIKLSCYDIKYKLDTPYDSDKYTFPMTLKEWRNAIFTNCGVIYDDSDFPNCDLNLNKEPYVGDNQSNRQVISQIAQAGASFVVTDNYDKFYFNWFNTIVHTVDDWIELTTEKADTPLINVVVLGRGNVEDNVYYPETLPENKTELRIDNNYILDPQDNSETDRRHTVISPIYNRVSGFSFIPFSMKTQDVSNKLSINIGDKISYVDIWGNSLTSYVMGKKITYLGGNPTSDDNYEIVLSAEEIKETSTDYSYGSTIENKLLKVERKADKQSGQIEDLIEVNDEFSRDISQLKLEQNSISASVNKIVNTVRTITGMHKLTLPNAMAGNMLELSIKGNISLLFLKFYLGSNTFFKNSNLVIKCGENIRKIKLPLTYLDYLNSDVFDEFTIDRNGICKKITRIGTDEQGNKVALSNEKIEEVGKIFIQLFEGDNEIYLESFANDDVTYTASYATKNELTDVFTTSVDAKASFELQDEKMDLKLEKKTDNDKLIAQINLSTEKNEDGSLIQIESDKLNIKNKKFNLLSDEIEITSPNFSVNKDGRIVATSGEIGGFSLLSNTFSVCIKDKYDYDQTDIVRMNEIKNGSTATEEEMAKYDINENGNVDTDDIFEVLRKINGYANTAGEFVLSSDDPKFIIKTTGNGSQTRFTKIGLSEIETYKIYATTAFFESLTDSTSKTDISGGNITCASLTQTSLEKNKKNFEIFKSGIEEVMKTDIYKYNLKSEQDNKKKHLGFVIGKKYNYSKLITVIDDDGNEIGVDNYSMTSLCLQAIKEQQLIIQNLENRIKRLEEISNGTNSKEGI